MADKVIYDKKYLEELASKLTNIEPINDKEYVKIRYEIQTTRDNKKKLKYIPSNVFKLDNKLL